MRFESGLTASTLTCAMTKDRHARAWASTKYRKGVAASAALSYITAEREWSSFAPAFPTFPRL